MSVKFWASSESVGVMANSLLVAASRTRSAGWRRGVQLFSRRNAGQSPGELLTGGSARYSWCPCSRSPAGYARVRRLSPHSPSCMLLWTGPSLSRAEPRGADSLGSVRHSEGTGGLVRCFYGTARESGVSFVRELHQSHKKDCLYNVCLSVCLCAS